MALRVVAFSLMIALVVQCSLAVDEVDTKATCADGDASCELDSSTMLQVHTDKEMFDEGYSEVAQLLFQVSDCAGQATAFVQTLGKTWADITDLLLPQNSMFFQLINATTPMLKKARMVSLTLIGIAEHTKAQCPESLQQTNASRMLEATQALNEVITEQVEEIFENGQKTKARWEQVAKLVSSVPLLEPLMCPAFTHFVKNFYNNTIATFREHLHTLTLKRSEGRLLQVEGTAAAMAQSLRLTDSTCQGELSAFVAYAKDMVQYCTAVRGCTTTLRWWTGLDQASQKCIDVFSNVTMESQMRICK